MIDHILVNPVTGKTTPKEAAILLHNCIKKRTKESIVSDIDIIQNSINNFINNK